MSAFPYDSVQHLSPGPEECRRLLELIRDRTKTLEARVAATQRLGDPAREDTFLSHALLTIVRDPGLEAAVRLKAIDSLGRTGGAEWTARRGLMSVARDSGLRPEMRLAALKAALVLVNGDAFRRQRCIKAALAAARSDQIYDAEQLILRLGKLDHSMREALLDLKCDTTAEPAILAAADELLTNLGVGDDDVMRAVIAGDDACRKKRDKLKWSADKCLTWWSSQGDARAQFALVAKAADSTIDEWDRECVLRYLSDARSTNNTILMRLAAIGAGSVPDTSRKERKILLLCACGWRRMKP